MISPKPLLMIRVCFCFFILLLSNLANSQCNPPDQNPTIDCESAPLVCLQNACYDTDDNDVNCCNGWCGANTAIHNPQYFAFIPTCPDVEIDIHVDGCSSGQGLQAAILDACPWDNSNVVACDPGTPAGGTMVLIASGLIPGQTYWLVIDGSSGATCNYTINFTSCVFAPGFNGESLTSGSASPSSACQGYNSVVLGADPAIPFAHGYWWVLEWSGDTVISTENFTTIDIPEDVDPGIYDICVTAFSGCDTSDMDFCFQIEVYEIPPEIKDPATFCFEEFPFNWGAVTITGEGDYEQTYHDADGCFYDSLWTVEEYPVPDVGQIDTVHCLPDGETTFYYEGEPYDDSGTYLLEYPKSDVNGCDSTAELNLRLIGLDAFVEVSCENGEFVLTVFTQEVIPGNAQLTYEWFDSGTLVFDNNPFLTLQPGCYTVEVTVDTPEGFCTFTLDQTCFVGSDYYPPAPVLANDDTLICAQAGVFFNVIPDPDGEPNLDYDWSAPSDVNVFENGTGTVEMDFSNSAGGQVCVYAIGMCGQGPSTCFNVDILPAPVASFTYTPNVCIDQVSTITFTGSASVNSTVIWDFNNPTTLTGTGVGPYNVSWGLDGAKTITLTVIEPGCDTATFSAVVNVSQLAQPNLNCGSATINSITFDWDDVAGASSYMLSLDGAPAFVVPASTHTQTGLTPGQMVQAILTVVSPGPCPNIMDTVVCIAQNCPPPVIVLSGQDSACLNTPTIIDLDATVNGNPGSGTWSGPGIVDPAAGLFDPKVAGVGLQIVTYTEVVNSCPFSEPFSITVFDSLTADFTLDPLICITDAANLQYTGNASGGANYMYSFGTANVLAGTGVGPYQLSWNSPGQQTVRLQVSENGCMSDVITHTTDVIASLNGPVFNCAPMTSNVDFNWVGDPLATGFDTTVLTGQTGVVNGNTITFNGLVPGDTVRLSVVTHSAGPCPDRIDTFYCVARVCPMPYFNITPVPDICLIPATASVNLQVTVTNGNGVGTWSGPGVSNAKFDPVAAGPGAHLLNYQYIDDGCTFNNPLTINVYAVPDAFISNTDFMITCATNSLFLDGSGSSGGPLTYTWSTSTGAILGASDQPVAEVGAAGTYQLLVSNTVSGCKDSTSVVVTVDSNIPTPVAGLDRTITCDSTQFTLGGNSTSGPNIIYLWSTVGGNILGATNGLTIDVNRTGDYSILVKDTLTGCQAVDIATIGIDTALATIMLTPGDTIDCNTSVTTATSSLNEPVTDYTFQWSTIDGAISGSSTNQNVDVSQGGTYTLTIHNKRNGCEKSADVVVEESDEIIDDVDVTAKNITCFGDKNGELTINGVTGGIAPYVYSWSISPTGGQMLSALSPGVYTLTVNDNNGCSIIKSYTLTEPPLVTIDLGPNLTVAAMDSVKIDILTNLTPGAIAKIDWGGYDGLLCPDCPSFEFLAGTSATISAMITDTAGCTAEDSMRLTVITPRIIFIPNVFSPNGDNKNDYFTISGRFNLIRIADLKIYDRWGNQVFGKSDFPPGIDEEGWDGTFEGKAMQPGVYVYVATLDYEDISETVSGNLTLLK